MFEEVEFGDTDAVFTRDHAAQILGQLHDALNRMVGLLQHGVIVGVDRNVGVHVAVAGVHVQRDKHAALQHALVHGIALFEYQLVGATAENLLEYFAYFALPGGTDAVIL